MKYHVCIYHHHGAPAIKCLHCTDRDGKVTLIWLCELHYTPEIIAEYRLAWQEVEC